MNPFGANEDSDGSLAPAKASANPFGVSNSSSPNPFDAPASVPSIAPPKEPVVESAPAAEASTPAPAESSAPAEPTVAVQPVAPVAPLPTQTIPEAQTVAVSPTPVVAAVNNTDAPVPAVQPEPAVANVEGAASSAPTVTVDLPTATPEPVIGDVPKSPPSNPATPAPSVVDTPEPVNLYPPAWQPFTLSGVAAFAHASVNRLLLVQLFMALMVGATVLWFVDRNYSPALVGAMKKMPEEAAIRRGILLGASSQLLAENKFLSVAIDLQQTNEIGQSADLQLELHRQDFRLCSIFRSATGVVSVSYPPITRIPMGDAALEPWWGAWHPIFYLSIVLGVTLALMITWTLLATVYALIPRLIAYYADRALRTDQAWNVAGAALMPGALIMEAAILLYGFQILDLIGLGMFAAIHIVVGWIYVIGAPFFVPRMEEHPAESNPFDD